MMLTSLLEHVLAFLPVIAMQGFVISSFSPKTSLFWYGGGKRQAGRCCFGEWP